MERGPSIAVTILETERDKERARHDELVETLRKTKQTIKALDAAIATLNGGPEVAAQAELGTVKERILMILATDGPGMTPKEIADHLTASGRTTTNTTVSSILSRLQDEEQVEKVGVGRWRALLDTAIHRLNDEGDRDERSPESIGGGSVRERGYPPSAPGGSNPPTSTVSHLLPNWSEVPDPDEDDIPF